MNPDVAASDVPLTNQAETAPALAHDTLTCGTKAGTAGPPSEHAPSFFGAMNFVKWGPAGFAGVELGVAEAAVVGVAPAVGVALGVALDVVLDVGESATTGTPEPRFVSRTTTATIAMMSKTASAIRT
jgi:hypothetical protein